MGWPFIEPQKEPTGSGASSMRTPATTANQSPRFSASALFSTQRRSLSPLNMSAHAAIADTALTTNEIVEITLTKASAFFNAAQDQFNHYRDALFLFIEKHFTLLATQATQHENLLKLIPLYEENLLYKEFKKILHPLPSDSLHYRAAIACCHLFCGSVISGNNQIEKNVLSQIDLADDRLAVFRDHCDAAILGLSKLITVIKRHYPELHDMHRLEGLLRQTFQQMYHNELPALEIRFSDEIRRLIPSDNIANEVIQQTAKEIDDHLTLCNHALIERNQTFCNAQNDISKNMFFIVYLAKKNPRVANFITHPKMDPFWQRTLSKELSALATTPVYFQIHKGLNPLTLWETIQCDRLTNTIKSLPQEIIEQSPIAEIYSVLTERANQIELFNRLAVQHEAIGQELSKLETPQSQEWLVMAVQLVMNDPTLSDTSCIFPRTVEAQHLFGPAALLQEVRNKLCIADALCRYSLAIEKKANKKAALIFAQIYLQRALHDIYLAKILEADFEAATNNALLGSSLLDMIKLNGYPAFTTWLELEQGFLSYMGNIEIDVSPALIHAIQLEAQRTAIERFDSTPEKAKQGLRTFTSQLITPQKPTVRVSI